MDVVAAAAGLATVNEALKEEVDLLHDKDLLAQ